jgi:hypothetical protein
LLKRKCEVISVGIRDRLRALEGKLLRRLCCKIKEKGHFRQNIDKTEQILSKITVRSKTNILPQQLKEEYVKTATVSLQRSALIRGIHVLIWLILLKRIAF